MILGYVHNRSLSLENLCTLVPGQVQIYLLIMIMLKTCKDIPSGHIWTTLLISSKGWIPCLSKSVLSLATEISYSHHCNL
uniref:Protein arginine N-methyltransferase n=1 Tax=Rhizophora mucronata TaxID=61149 RepID=A0A2P2MP06_RHIMU